MQSIVSPATAILLVLLGLLADCQAGVGTPRLVVVLYPEASNGNPGSILADRALRATFASGSSEQIEVHNEHLEVSRFPDPVYQQDLAGFLKRKYSGRKVDLVIACLASALDFALQHRDEIFPRVPIICMAVDHQELKSRALPADVIGYPIAMDLAGSLDLALQLHPQTKQVYVIVGTSKFDASWEAKARAAFAPFVERVELAYLTGLPLADLESTVERLPAHSLIYYLHVFTDHEGRVYTPADVVERLAAKANAPIYSHVDSYLDRGIVGGRMFSFERAGNRAATLGLRILAGEDAEHIGMQSPIENANIFDWRQLRRWDIPEANLPAGSEIRYRELTLWEQYKWPLIIVASLCGLQAVLLAGMLAQRVRKGRADSQLRESREELRRLAGQILGAQETERRRIARELHDDFGQDLALLSVELDLYLQQPPTSQADAVARIDAMSSRVKQLSSCIHDLSHQLHPMKLEQLGLVAATRGLCHELNQNQGLKTEFTHAGVPANLPPDVALCLYRIAQEALRNVVKHSGAKIAKVSLHGSDDSIRLEISDNGKGFDPAAVTGKGGLGLISMRERLRQVNGELILEAQRSPGAPN